MPGGFIAIVPVVAQQREGETTEEFVKRMETLAPEIDAAVTAFGDALPEGSELVRPADERYMTVIITGVQVLMDAIDGGQAQAVAAAALEALAEKQQGQPPTPPGAGPILN